MAKKRKAPSMDAQQAMATAYAQAAAKLDALIAVPCRQDALDAIALCRRAATLTTKAHEMRQKTAEKEKAAVVKAKEAVKRKALAQKAKKKKLAAKRKKALQTKQARRGTAATRPLHGASPVQVQE